MINQIQDYIGIQCTENNFWTIKFLEVIRSHTVSQFPFWSKLASALLQCIILCITLLQEILVRTFFGPNFLKNQCRYNPLIHTCVYITWGNSGVKNHTGTNAKAGCGTTQLRPFEAVCSALMHYLPCSFVIRIAADFARIFTLLSIFRLFNMSYLTSVILTSNHSLYCLQGAMQFELLQENVTKQTCQRAD